MNPWVPAITVWWGIAFRSYTGRRWFKEPEDPTKFWTAYVAAKFEKLAFWYFWTSLLVRVFPGLF